MAALIDPSQFPVIAGDMMQLRTDARTIDDAGVGIAEVGALVHARWQDLGPVYQTPDAATLMAATEPVRTLTAAVGANYSDSGTILTTYADTVETLQQELASLRAQADTLRADAAAARPDPWEIVGDIAGNALLPLVGPIAAAQGVRSTLTEPWRDDPDLVARNTALVAAIAELVAAYEQAQRQCASDLNALHGAAPITADDGDGVPEPGEYGFTVEQYRTAAAEGALPWGAVVAQPQPWGLDVISAPWRFAQGATDAVVGTAVGLAALGGYHPDSGFDHAGATAGAAWSNLGKLLLAAGTYLTPGGAVRDQIGAVPFLAPGEGGHLLTDTGKALVAWDQWDDDPARAGGLAVTNIALAVVGTRGVGAVARSLGTAIQAGRSAGITAQFGAGLTRVGGAIGRLPTLTDIASTTWRRLHPTPDLPAAPNVLDSAPDPGGGPIPRETGLGSIADDLAPRAPDSASDTPSPAARRPGDDDPGSSVAPVAPETSPGEGPRPPSTADGVRPSADAPPMGRPLDDTEIDEANQGSEVSPAGGGPSPATAPHTDAGAGSGLEPDLGSNSGAGSLADSGRRFDSNVEAADYGARYWNDYAESLPEPQRTALHDYTMEPPHTRPTYREINGYLRGQRSASPEIIRQVEQIDAALANRPIPEDLQVTRGTGVSFLGVAPPDLVGRVVEQPAYLSTSLGRPASAFASAEAILHLRAPAGTPAIWVERVSAFGGERELLLGRGLRYRIDRVESRGGQWHMYGEILPP